MTLKLKRANHRVITRSRTLPSRIDKAYYLFDVGRDLLRKEVGNNNQFRLLGIGVNDLESDLTRACLIFMVAKMTDVIA